MEVTIGEVTTTLSLAVLTSLAETLGCEAALGHRDEATFSFAVSCILNEAIVDPVRHKHGLADGKTQLRAGHQAVVYVQQQNCCPSDWSVTLRRDVEHEFFNTSDFKLTELEEAVTESQAYVRGNANTWWYKHRLVLSMPMTCRECTLLLSMSSADSRVGLWSMPLFPTVSTCNSRVVAAMLGLQQAALATFVRNPGAFKHDVLPTVPCPFSREDIDAGHISSVNERVFKVFYPRKQKQNKKKQEL